MSKRLTLQARIEAAPQQSGRYVLRATAYNVPAASGIVVLPGAFAESLPQLVTRGYMLYQHQQSMLPIGHIIEYQDTGEELLLTVEFYDHDFAQQVKGIVDARLDSGRYVGVSIGYYVQDGDLDYVDGQTIVRRGEIVECSIVLWGDNPEAEVVTRQSMRDEITTVEEMISMAAYAVHALARRVEAVRKLRAAEQRTISQATKESMQRLSHRAAQIAQALQQVAAQAYAVVGEQGDREELQRARKQLVSLIQEICHD